MEYTLYMGDFVEKTIGVILTVIRIAFPLELLAVILIIVIFSIWKSKRGNNQRDKIAGDSKRDP